MPNVLPISNRQPGLRTRCIVERITPRNAPSKRKIWTNPLVLPARLSGAAAPTVGNRTHRYIGKVCCLLLVRADLYRVALPGAAPARPRRARGIAQAVTLTGKMLLVSEAQALLSLIPSWARSRQQSRACSPLYIYRFRAGSPARPGRPLRSAG